MIKKKYEVTWHSYTNHLRKMMENMLQSNEWSDVTLVCEDKNQMKAHKNILSSASDFFRDIFHLDKNPTTVIYLKGIKSTEMELILQYIYLGEAVVYEEKINSLLSVAKSLDIRDLCENTEIDELKDYSETEGILECIEKNDITNEFKIKLKEKSEDQERTIEPTREGSEEDPVLEEIVSTGELHKNTHEEPNDPIGNSEKLTGMESGQIHETYEIMKFDCNQCDFQTTKDYYLKSHIRTIHEKVKYNCVQCDSQFSQKCHLKTHIQIKHEGIRYHCKHCDYVTTNKQQLKNHTQAQHDGILYHCKHCDYKSGYKSKIREHMNQKHFTF